MRKRARCVRCEAVIKRETESLASRRKGGREKETSPSVCAMRIHAFRWVGAGVGVFLFECGAWDRCSAAKKGKVLQFGESYDSVKLCMYVCACVRACACACA